MIKNVSPNKFHKIENKNRHNAANPTYNLLFIEDQTGDIVTLLFTNSDIHDALKRANKNKEDIPEYRLKSKKDCVDTLLAGVLCVLGFVSGVATCWAIMQTFN
jgi:hypothetical protein